MLAAPTHESGANEAIDEPGVQPDAEQADAAPADDTQDDAAELLAAELPDVPEDAYDAYDAMRHLGKRRLGDVLIDAGVIVSNADPKRTYLTLVPNGQLPGDYQRAIEEIKIDSPVMKINLATSELPKYWMLKDDEQRQGSSGGLFVAPSIDYVPYV